MHARDLMRPNAPSLPFDSTVEDAIVFFKNNPSVFVAVKAAEDRYQGVLTEGKLVQVFIRYQSQKAKDSLIFYRDCFEPMQLVHEEEAFPQVVKKIMSSIGNRVFVINSASAIIGVITAKDILPYFAIDESQLQNQPALQLPIETLKSELYLYESFFDKSPFMMHSVDSKGVIQMANEALHAVLGYEYGELIGKTIFDLYPKENHKKAEAGIKTIMSRGFHQVIQAQMLSKQNEEIAVELASRALQDQNNNSVGTMTVSRPLNMEILLKALEKPLP